MVNDKLLELADEYGVEVGENDTDWTIEEAINEAMQEDDESYYFLTFDSVINSKYNLLYHMESYYEENDSSDGFKESTTRIINEFYEKLSKCDLPEMKLPWKYAFYFEREYLGLAMESSTTSYHLDIDGSVSADTWVEEQFLIFKVNSKLLTVNEYAERYGVEPVTVRQWIRRGKIRAAIKEGAEWRIPETAEMPNSRKYIPGNYSWSGNIEKLPSGFEDLNDYNCLRIEQAEEKGMFLLHFAMSDSGYCSGKSKQKKKKMIIDSKGREKLEVFLIGNPKIQCKENSFILSIDRS